MARNPLKRKLDQGLAGNSPRGRWMGPLHKAPGPTRFSALGTLSEHQGPVLVSSNGPAMT